MVPHHHELARKKNDPSLQNVCLKFSIVPQHILRTLTTIEVIDQRETSTDISTSKIRLYCLKDICSSLDIPRRRKPKSLSITENRCYTVGQIVSRSVFTIKDLNRCCREQNVKTRLKKSTVFVDIYGVYELLLLLPKSELNSFFTSFIRVNKDSISLYTLCHTRSNCFESLVQKHSQLPYAPEVS